MTEKKQRPLTARTVQKDLAALGNKERAKFLAGFFKTGPGQYGEGDRFRGIRVPQTRKIASLYRDLPLAECARLLDSLWHEDRLLSLIILVNRMRRATAEQQSSIVELYLSRTERINNWDLVDTSAGPILGAFLFRGDRSLLYRLVTSNLIWERRIAILATQYFMRKGETEDTFRLASALLADTEDLIHKAAGWMLREAGKRDRKHLEAFLGKHASTMPRTMLRYAIEHLPSARRQHFMKL